MDALEMRKRAQELRKTMTLEERTLWYQYLRTYPVQWNRQKVFGKYIVDFYCYKANLVVELDGSQHYEDLHRQKDHQRDAELIQKGYTVLRYSNVDINQRFQSVCDDIWNCIHKDKEI